MKYSERRPSFLCQRLPYGVRTTQLAPKPRATTQGTNIRYLQLKIKLLYFKNSKNRERLFKNWKKEPEVVKQFWEQYRPGARPEYTQIASWLSQVSSNEFDFYSYGSELRRTQGKPVRQVIVKKCAKELTWFSQGVHTRVMVPSLLSSSFCPRGSVTISK